eukprot:m.4492 g.4492  ORF g.4492 m.4492 type:complete len:261 (+) comp10840_c0_seq1:244-1026(+)
MRRFEGNAVSEISEMLKSPVYAEIFGVLFSRPLDAHSCDDVVEWVKENPSGLAVRCEKDLDEHLNREESEMKEKIRAFTEQQEAILCVRKAQVERTKSVFMQLAKEIANGSCTSSKETISSSERLDIGGIDDREISSSAADDEELFDFDGFESSGRLWEESDVEHDDANEDNCSDSLSADSYLAAPVLASSLPISTPGFGYGKDRKGNKDPNLEEACEFENIGESMKKIALSVHEHSTAMFGDLPRPRVNSDAAHRFPRK